MPELKRDFQERCAYCMRSLKNTGDREIEIDHFNPQQKKDRIQNYQNLFLADRSCNGKKDDNWPSKEDTRKGLRFLNCCEEQDYGVHIFEDTVTHELIGVTPAAVYHIETIDLNAPHLVGERQRRAEIRKLLKKKKGWLKVENFDCAYQSWVMLEKFADDMIPPIPTPPARTAVENVE
ncbi:MAG: HNH endonuclease [Betaproteobacteria bacterium]|nr:HNH endonuclease [Betaproteobacteria bacterium]